MSSNGVSHSHSSSFDAEPQLHILGDFCIDEYRPVKVIVIGAGFSGITAGVR